MNVYSARRADQDLRALNEMDCSLDMYREDIQERRESRNVHLYLLNTPLN